MDEDNEVSSGNDCPAVWRVNIGDIDLGVLVSKEDHHQYLAIATNEQQQEFLKKTISLPEMGPTTSSKLGADVINHQ